MRIAVAASRIPETQAPTARAERLRLAQGAFEAFVAHHRDRALALAWRLCGGDAAAAEDVAQEAFVRAYRGLDRFRSEATLSTWFTRILVNEARRHRRWSWVRERVAGAMPADRPAPAAEEGRDPLVRERVAHALARLPRGQREAFVLVRLEGLSLREAAEVAQRSTGTIKRHLHRAHGALRAQLADLDPKRDCNDPREGTR
jgi:RNA polymerase sigma factor (sigma-70 family)